MRLQIQNRPADELELVSHVNETIGSLRRQIYIKTKLNPQINKIDLIINNECIECMEDNKTLSDYQLKEKLEKMYIIARITQSPASHHHSSHSQHQHSPNLNLNLNSSTSSATAVGPTTGTGNRANCTLKVKLETKMSLLLSCINSDMCLIIFSLFFVLDISFLA